MQKQSPGVDLYKSSSEKFRKIHRKIAVQEFFFFKQSCSLHASNIIKAETLKKVFSYEFCEMFENVFFVEYLRARACDFDNEHLPSIIKQK